MGWIELDGAVNVRDVGGLPTEDGRQVVTGRLLRGDNLQDLSPADVRLLVADIGLTTVVDLRSPQEIAAEGPGPLTRVGSVRHARHSVLPEIGAATDVAAAALATTRRNGAESRYPDDLRCGSYLGYLEDRPDQVVAALRGIATDPGPAARLADLCRRRQQQAEQRRRQPAGRDHGGVPGPGRRPARRRAAVAVGPRIRPWRRQPAPGQAAGGVNGSVPACRAMMPAQGSSVMASPAAGIWPAVASSTSPTLQETAAL